MKVSLMRPLMIMRPMDTRLKTRMAPSLGLLTVAQVIWVGNFPRTLEWIVKNKIETVTSHILTPYPGTAQHARMLRDGRITSDDQTLYTTSEVVFSPLKMSAEQLKSGYLKIYEDIYSFKNIMKRLPKHQRIGHLLFNFIYRKYGKMTESICKFIGFNNIGLICKKLSFNL